MLHSQNSISWARFAAKIGMVGIVPDYRTKGRHDTSPLATLLQTAAQPWRGSKRMLWSLALIQRGSWSVETQQVVTSLCGLRSRCAAGFERTGIPSHEKTCAGCPFQHRV